MEKNCKQTKNDDKCQESALQVIVRETAEIKIRGKSLYLSQEAKTFFYLVKIYLFSTRQNFPS